MPQVLPDLFQDFGLLFLQIGKIGPFCLCSVPLGLSDIRLEDGDVSKKGIVTRISRNTQPKDQISEDSFLASHSVTSGAAYRGVYGPLLPNVVPRERSLQSQAVPKSVIKTVFLLMRMLPGLRSLCLHFWL